MRFETWAPEIAESIARSIGLSTLNEKHWKVIFLVREDTIRTARVPTLSRVVELSGFTERELSRMFPGDPCQTAARIAGLGRPDEASAVPGQDPHRWENEE